MSRGTKIKATFVVVALTIVGVWAYSMGIDVLQGQLAVDQLKDNALSYTLARELSTTHAIGALLLIAVAAVLAMIWRSEIAGVFKKKEETNEEK